VPAPRPTGELLKRDVYRPDDGFVARLEFDNLEVVGSGATLQPKDPGKASSIRLVLPPQHFVDIIDRGGGAPATQPLYSSGPSALLFAWPPTLSIDYTLDGLLDTLNLLPVVLLPADDTSVSSTSDWASFIEYPLGLRLQPTDATLRAYNPHVDKAELKGNDTELAGQRELWHLRFVEQAALKRLSGWYDVSKQAEADEPPLTLRSVQSPVPNISPVLAAAQFNPGSSPTDPQSGKYLVIAGDGRQEISDYTNHADPDVIKATTYALTPQGIVSDLAWSTRSAPQGNYTPLLDGLAQRTYLGVDSEFKESIACTAVPTNHWISYERPIVRAADETDGFARLEAPKAYLVLRKPLEEYTGEVAKKLGAKAIRLKAPHPTDPDQPLNASPPIFPIQIDASTPDAFRAYLDKNGKNEFVWQGEKQGFDGNWTPTEYRFIYIKNGKQLTTPGYAAQIKAKIATTWDADASLRSWTFEGRPYCITDFNADPRLLKNATVNLFEMALALPDIQIDSSVPAITPKLDYFVATIPQVRNAAVGDLTKGAFQILTDPAIIGQTAQQFAKAIDIAGLPKISLGGITPPDAVTGMLKGLPSIGQLALEYGPIFGELKQDADIASAFLDDVKMFGADVTQIIKDALIAKQTAIPYLKEWVKQQGEDALHQAELAITTYALDQEKKLPIPGEDFLQIKLLADTVIDIAVQILLAINDLPKLTRTVTYTLTGKNGLPVVEIKLSLAGTDYVTFQFKSITITCELGKSPHVSAPLYSVDLGPALKALEEAVSKLTADVAPTITYALDYLYTGLSIQLPNINSGAFSLRNFVLISSIGLPIGDKPPAASFSIGTRAKPLTLAVGIYTGHAFFEYDSPANVQFELDFGVSAALEFLDIASGMVDVAVGFYVAVMENDTKIDLHLRASGHLSVCGIVSIDVLFYFAFEADNSHYYGEGEVDVDIDILFVISISVQLKMRKEFSSQNAAAVGTMRPGDRTDYPLPTYEDFMTQQDWSDYCDSF